MPDPTPNGARVYAEQKDGTRTDITEGVQALYDLIVASMDFGSGFLSIEDVIPIANVAYALGFGDANGESVRNYIEKELETEKRLIPRYGNTERSRREIAAAEAWIAQYPRVWPTQAEKEEQG